MTGKDLLKGLSFVDEDLIEEAGKETLSEEKRSGKVIFLRTIISAAAGLLIFFAGTAVGSRIAVKPLHNEGQPEGVAVLGIYQSEEEQNTLYGGAGEAMPQEGMADAQSGEMSVQEGMVDAQAENSDIRCEGRKKDRVIADAAGTRRTSATAASHGDWWHIGLFLSRRKYRWLLC